MTTLFETGERLGNFEVESGRLNVSDPCYDLGTWCAGVVDNCKLGTWRAEVVKSCEGSWGVRCAALLVHHKDYSRHTLGKYASVTAEFEVGVDSGQAGVFDLKWYKADQVVKESLFTPGLDRICEDEPWYSLCCDRTMGEMGAGTIPHGAVSSSGFGDGCYEAEIFKNEDGECIAIQITFIPKEDEEDEEDDWEENDE